MLLPQSVIRIVLDVREVEKQVSFTVTQSDTVRRLIINLCDKGKPYVIGKGCYAVFSAITSKGVGIARSCKIEGNEIIYDLMAADVATVGRMDCDITLFGASGESITSPGFLINVYKSKMVAQSGEIVASEDFTALQGLIGDVNERIAKIDDILESDGKTIEDAINKGVSDIDKHAADVVESLPGTYVEVANDVKIHQKEIWARPSGTIFRDGAVAYKKTVPAIALPVAKIVKIGGMTTKIESIGPNLLPTPYFDASGNKYGAEFTINADGSVSIGGTATQDTNFIFSKTLIFEHGKTYSISPNVIVFYRNAEGEAKYGEATLTWDDAYTLYQIYAYIPKGAVSKIIYPMISERVDKNEDPKTLPYKPYNKATFLIPEALKNLDGYGYVLNETVYNYIDFEKKQFVKRVGFDGTNYYELEKTIITNMSDILPSDNFIWVNRGGTLTFVNEHGLAVPSEVIYYLEVVSGVMADGTPALKVGDTIITQEQIRSLLNGAGGGSGIAARIGEVTILANKWVGASSPYSQVVNIAGVTENSQVDLTPSVEQLAVFHNKDLAFVTENEGGVVTVYAIGDKPTNDYTIQVTITEVEV